MANRYPDWSGPARHLADTVDAAVRAAVAGDGDAFAETRTDLRRVDPEVLATLLGSMTQDLLEVGYPDGLDSEDAAALIDGCAAPWFEGFDRDLVAIALLGALGLHDPEQTPDADPALVTAHGLLLVAALLPSGSVLTALVGSALRELHRAQTVELP